MTEFYPIVISTAILVVVLLATIIIANKISPLEYEPYKYLYDVRIPYDKLHLKQFKEEWREEIKSDELFLSPKMTVDLNDKPPLSSEGKMEIKPNTLTGEVVMFVRESPTFEKSAIFTCQSEYKFIEIQDKCNKVLMRINIEGETPVCEVIENKSCKEKIL